MARRKAPVIQAEDAHPQDQSKLISELPAELRTYVWELALYVQPGNDGTVSLSRHTPEKKYDDGTRSVLTLLLTYRLINREAAGIFYNMHRLSVESPRNMVYRKKTLQWTGGSGFFDIVNSQARLNGIRDLTVHTTWHFEEITKACRVISKSLPRIKTLAFDMADSHYAPGTRLEYLQKEEHFFKKVMRKLPISVKVFKVALGMGGWVRQGGPIAVSAVFATREMLESIISKFLDMAKVEVVVEKADG